MNEILYFPVSVAIAFLLHYLLNRGGKKKDTAAVEESLAELEQSVRVHEIIASCHRDLREQGARGYGPWLSAFLDGDDLYISGYGYRGRPIVEVTRKGVEPSVALTAIRWTIRDILSAPVLYDKDGKEIPRRVCNLEKLHEAETELMEMTGEAL